MGTLMLTNMRLIFAPIASLEGMEGAALSTCTYPSVTLSKSTLLKKFNLSYFRELQRCSA